jgi:hypothetical protein
MGPFARWLPALALPLTVGCLSPTLPMPPPGDPRIMTISADGMSAHLEGIGVPPNAEVYARNQELWTGGFTTADVSGHYALDVPLDLPRYGAHHIEIWYELDGESSEPHDFRIPTFGSWSPAGAADAGAADASGD